MTTNSNRVRLGNKANPKGAEDAVVDAASNNPNIKYLLIVATSINEIDASGAEAISGVVDELAENNITLVFAGCNKQTVQTLKRSGVYKKIGEKNFVRNINRAMEVLNKRLQENAEVDEKEV